MTTTPRTRRRVQLEATAVTSEQAPTTTIEEDAVECWRLMSIAAEAERTAKGAMEKLDLRMKKDKRTALEINGLRDRPPLIAGYGQSTTNTVDPKGYQRLVTPEQFLSSVKVSITEAKKHTTETALRKITTEKKGEPSLFLKKRPKDK